MIKVLVADDHAVVRRGLRQILTETPDILVGRRGLDRARGPAARARSSAGTSSSSTSTCPGAAASSCSASFAGRPEPARLVLTVYPEEQYAVRAIRAGAAGFLTKESAPERAHRGGAQGRRAAGAT